MEYEIIYFIILGLDLMSFKVHLVLKGDGCLSLMTHKDIRKGGALTTFSSLMRKKQLFKDLEFESQFDDLLRIQKC